MIATSRGPGPVAYALILLIALAGSTGPARAQGVESAIPANASANTYGTRWRCNSGFRKVDGACVVVSVPENAFLTDSSYGSGWRCRYGYRENGGACDPIALPSNAYLSGASGDRWLCERGYRRVSGSCAAIDVPANGYLTESSNGSGWA